MGDDDTIDKHINLSTPTIEQIYSHGSMRHYKGDPIPIEMIETIVAAGQRSSTSSNLQTYSVVAVTDPMKIHRLAELCGDQNHVRQAPVFLTWCADLYRLDRVCQLRGYKQETDYVENFLVAAVDAAIAMQNAALAAESLRLGICYIGSIRNNPLEVIKLLELPRLTFPISGMTVGWPARVMRIRPRLPLNCVLHWERYETSNQDHYLANYDHEMVETGIYKGRQVTAPGKPNATEDYGWMEHSARRASSVVRKNLRHALSNQGFQLK